jgi:DNA-binding MarR family transcriptional regulator
MAAIGPETLTSQQLATQIGEPLSDVHRTLVRLVEAGLVDATDGRVRLTEAGRQAVATVAAPTVATADPVEPLGEMVEAAQSLGSAWMARSQREAAERERASAALLASDDERDAAVRHLAEAFTQGRLSAAELDERTGRALAARTHGELDIALVGLGGLRREAGRHPVRAVVFWLATVLLSPFLLFGSLFVLFGDDAGDRVVGLVFLALTAPPLFGLWWWARPRP